MQARPRIIQPAAVPERHSVEELVGHVLPRVWRAGVFVEGVISSTVPADRFKVRKEEEAHDILRSLSHHIQYVDDIGPQGVFALHIYSLVRCATAVDRLREELP
mmetsp:Transcript_16560/g.23203  ORF Transcript_16560/g.23203 Transcript_16560/m.23203 type:complete len:104 (+) Transcript_16560:703-1014(+)